MAQPAGDVERLARLEPDHLAILELQVKAPGDQLEGAIAQAIRGRSVVEQYFPFYVARAVSGLLALWSTLGGDRYRDGAVAGHGFLARSRDADGAFPQVMYRGDRVNRYPRWIAGAADIVRALDLLRAAGADTDPQPTLDWLTAGHLPSGGFRIADGFASQVSQKARAGAPDARDFMPVVGWNDKAFRVLAERSSGAAVPGTAPEPAPAERAVSWRGRSATMTETADEVRVVSAGRVLYRWQKGADWASIE